MRKDNFVKSSLCSLTAATVIASSLVATAAKADQQLPQDKLLTVENLCMPGTQTLHVFNKAVKTYTHTPASFFFIIPTSPEKDQITPTTDSFAYGTCVLQNYISKKLTNWSKNVPHVDLAVFSTDLIKADRELSQGDIKQSIEQLVKGDFFAPTYKPVHAVSVTFLRKNDKAETSYITVPYDVVDKDGNEISNTDKPPPQNIVPRDPRVQIANLISQHQIETKKAAEQYFAAVMEFYYANVVKTGSGMFNTSPLPAPYTAPSYLLPTPLQTTPSAEQYHSSSVPATESTISITPDGGFSGRFGFPSAPANTESPPKEPVKAAQPTAQPAPQSPVQRSIQPAAQPAAQSPVPPSAQPSAPQPPAQPSQIQRVFFSPTSIRLVDLSGPR